MKKKYSVAPKDKKDWITFTKHLVNVYDKDLSDKIKKISKANIKDGGVGAFYIFLK